MGLQPRRFPLTGLRPRASRAAAALLGVLLAAAPALPLAAPALQLNTPSPDQDLARRAVQAGEALPLASLLPRVATMLGGEVAGVSFEREAGRWIYEFKVITAAGQLLEVQVDAKSARILGRGDE
jgi:hypothetical protein